MELINDYLVELQLSDPEIIRELQYQYTLLLEEYPEALTEAINPLYLPVYIIEFFIGALTFYNSSKRDEELTTFIQKLLKSSKWKVKIVNFDQKEKIYNAFSIGTRTVFLTKDLREALTFRECVAIALHEISHSKTWDVQIGFLAETTTGMAALLGTIAIVMSTGIAAVPAVPILLFFFNLVLASMADKAVSRRLEMKSDAFATKHGFGNELVTSLKKIDKLNKVRTMKCASAFCKVGRKIEGLLSSHPETKERIENVLKKKEFYEDLLKNPRRLMSLVKASL